MARWTDQGKHIAYCLLTSGEAGIDGIDPEQSRPLREQEQRNAAAIVGVHDVEFLGYPDGTLEYGIGMRRDLARVLRRHRPDMVITGNFRETWDGTALNQPDHIVAGRAALDAARDGNRCVSRAAGRRRTRAAVGREGPRGLVADVHARGRRHGHVRPRPRVLPRAPGLPRRPRPMPPTRKNSWRACRGWQARDSERGSPSPSSRCRCSCSSDCCSQHPVSPRRLR